MFGHHTDIVSGVLMALLLAALFGVGWLFYWGINETNGWAVAGSSVLFFPIFFMTGACAASFGDSDPEKKIESELQECMKKCGAQQS